MTFQLIDIFWKKFDLPVEDIIWVTFYGWLHSGQFWICVYRLNPGLIVVCTCLAAITRTFSRNTPFETPHLINLCAAFNILSLAFLSETNKKKNKEQERKKEYKDQLTCNPFFWFLLISSPSFCIVKYFVYFKFCPLTFEISDETNAHRFFVISVGMGTFLCPSCTLVNVTIAADYKTVDNWKTFIKKNILEPFAIGRKTGKNKRSNKTYTFR